MIAELGRRYWVFVGRSGRRAAIAAIAAAIVLRLLSMWPHAAGHDVGWSRNLSFASTSVMFVAVIFIVARRRMTS